MRNFNKDSKVKVYKIQYRFIKPNENVENKGYYVGILDLLSYMEEEYKIDNEIIEIKEFVVTKAHRNKGYGSKIIQDFVYGYDDKIIILFSGLSKNEFEDEPDITAYKETLSRLNKFYTKNGFINVNEYIGQYEHMETFIYNNNIGKEIVEKIKSKHEEFTKQIKNFKI